MMRYFWVRFKHLGSIDRLLMTITRGRKCGIFHLLVHNEYQCAFKLVQMKVEVGAGFCGALILNKKSSSNHNAPMKVLMGNILAFNTETLCSRLVWSLLWVLANFCRLPTPAYCPKRNKSAESPCFCVSMPPRSFSKYTVYSRWWSGRSTREPQTFASSVLSPRCKDTTSAVSWQPHVKYPSLFYWCGQDLLTEHHLDSSVEPQGPHGGNLLIYSYKQFFLGHKQPLQTVKWNEHNKQILGGKLSALIK